MRISYKYIIKDVNTDKPKTFNNQSEDIVSLNKKKSNLNSTTAANNKLITNKIIKL